MDKPSHIAGENVKWLSHFGKQFGSSSKNIATIRPSNCIPRYIPKRIKNILPRKNLYIDVRNSIIPNSQKVETKHSSTDEWISRMWYIIQWNVILPLKRNRALIHVTTWMRLEALRYVKEARHKGTHSVWFHLYEICRRGKSRESRSVVEKGWQKGGMGLTVNGHEVSFFLCVFFLMMIVSGIR